MSVFEHDDYYASPRARPAPPPPTPPAHHSDYDAYPLRDVPSAPPVEKSLVPPYQSRVSLADDNSYGGWRGPRDSMSDLKLTSHPGYDSDEEDFGQIPRERKKRTCLDLVCCGCCTCCPLWARWLSCSCLIILIALGITIGVLAGTFHMPQISFNGIANENFTSSANSFNISADLMIGIYNPNFEAPTFSSIKATSVGGGELDNVHINGKGTTNITFPFTIVYDAAQGTDTSMLLDIATKCGLTGGAKQDITINYDLALTIKIGVIPITITVPEKASFPCPLDILRTGISNDLV
ncbi:hypothetical protein BGW37DRAFT_514401 [Umbelopsis sp. PMI_123]|nr:hypothetical protein BGW37DRAFT_514401 [Umbelopsis sp. PMI_123]